MSKFFDESCQQSDEFEPVVPQGLCVRCYRPTLDFDETMCVDCITALNSYIDSVTTTPVLLTDIIF